MTTERVQRARQEKFSRQELDNLLVAVLGAAPVPVWCPAANVVREHTIGTGSDELRKGTRLLAPGAKVFAFPYLWATRGSETQLMVVSRHRASHRYTTLVMSARLLTNWRVDLVYSPHVIREFARVRIETNWWKSETLEENTSRIRRLTWQGTPESKAKAEQMVAHMRKLFPDQEERDTGGNE